MEEVEKNVAAVESGPLPAEIHARRGEITATVPIRLMDEPFGWEFGGFRGPGIAR
ncbi:MAG: hypothetical protein HPY44_17790 [Armatimonadetes bacterium]|nr:hypothetical protein [Armatimonadota bacterium]